MSQSTKTLLGIASGFPLLVGLLAFAVALLDLDDFYFDLLINTQYLSIGIVAVLVINLWVKIPIPNSAKILWTAMMVFIPSVGCPLHWILNIRKLPTH